MTEAFLHHLWKFKLFDSRNLLTTDGEEVDILKTGLHNTDAGPDFFNAQIKIGDTTWAGNVEIHLRSSDWNKHHHTEDASYNNVVLHVVHEHDEDVFTKEKTKILTVELKNRFDQKLFQNYLELIDGGRWIPCADHIGKTDAFTISNWLDRMLIERLEHKTDLIFVSLKKSKNNWEETFYHHLAKNFGFNINALPFEMLARSLPLHVLSKHRNHIAQVEALLFGQAGMLDKTFSEAYPAGLKQEYEFLRKKFSLSPMDGSQWKFLRLRPSNFPTVRIAQFAQLIHLHTGMFSKILSAENIHEMKTLFNVSASPFWLEHYSFGKASVAREKSLGEQALLVILINTVIPFVFAYGKHRSEQVLKDRAIAWMEALPPEKNSIITGWAELGITSSNACRTQALIQLKNEYCSRKKCLLCSIGNKIINSVP